MYQEERLKEILSIIESQKIVSVEALQGRLYVSTSTVRRDLAELSRRGLVVRSIMVPMSRPLANNLS